MSDTPRTDQILRDNGIEKLSSYPLATHSRQLERELNAKNHTLESLECRHAALVKENIEYAETIKELARGRGQLLILLADIRAAIGDPSGKLMQDELVERCKKLASMEGYRNV